MPRKNNPIREVITVKEEPLYQKWDGKSFPNIDFVGKSRGYRDSFRDIDTNTSVRTEFTRDDYEYFRQSESLPRDQRTTISMSMAAYKKVGLVRNVVDLMADFVCQGIHLVHPNESAQNFYREWFKRVNGDERSERFGNKLVRCGTLIARWSTATISPTDAEKLRKSIAADLSKDVFEDDRANVEKLEIPWKYTFLNPLSLEPVGEELAPFIGKPLFKLKLPSYLRRLFDNNDPQVRKLIKSLPKDIASALQNNERFFPLNPDRTRVYFYKKDDWEVWGEPLIAGVLADVIMLTKLKLADMAALDGAISRVRLWILGDLEKGIVPTQAGVDKLNNELINNVGGGTFDLIWGPAIDFKESSSDAAHFLGEDKYKPTLNALYAGLGIPPTLTGSATASGVTNNFISIRTLVERLKYIRGMLVDFWNYQIRLVQKAMGFRVPAEVRFDIMNMSDEQMEKKLYLDMADRNIISLETLQERFGELPELEAIRLKREEEAREKGLLPPKTSPWHNPQQDIEMAKIALGKGLVTPAEIGMELEEREPGDKPFADKQLQVQKQANQQKAQQLKKTKKAGVPGRPMMKKDSTKRKKKRVTVRTKAFLWAREAQKLINETATPIFLKTYGRKNVRQTTEEEARKLENYKFNLLCQFEPLQDLTEEMILDQMEKKMNIDSQANIAYAKFQEEFITARKKQPTVDQLRDMQIIVYLSMKELDDGEDSSHNGY